MGTPEQLPDIIRAYKDDPESVYNTWFINNDTRLKAFRAIRRGVEQVVSDIKEGSFPSDFKGSSLEIVLSAITEQKQVFEGAAHPFYWKPKLRIPDIYENGQNKRIFGQFLDACLNAGREDQLLVEIARLSRQSIKGLGPAVANILYFLHPTIIPPFNTAMVRGFNWLFGAKVPLGKWDAYLEMRDTILEAAERHRNLLSKDLGAISGLLFDVGVGKLVVEANVEQALAARTNRHKQVVADLAEENLHTKMQHLLMKMGKALGYDVIAAANDRTKCCDGDSFSFLSLPCLPDMGLSEEVRRTVDLIDAIWFTQKGSEAVCAFEVEKSTSIYSGILRLSDLALTLCGTRPVALYLVVPDAREHEVVAQLSRPSLRAQGQFNISYLLFSDVSKHCDSICCLGMDHTILARLAKRVS
ncbi:MAG: hypothetical protein ACYDCO_13350 [Armatimonadota bacterium]